ncbi:MAG: hypothetical protein Q8R29_01435 [bacterium]|nr:hypothetical protein [bacterium]
MMKRIIISLFTVALLIPSLAWAQEVKKGDTATVPGWTWVDVKNPEPVKSGNNDFGYGESCGIQHGGTITVVGIEENRLLVRYSIGGTQYGTSCPSGIIFFTTKETFSKMSAEYNRIRVAKQNEKDIVKRLLKKK